MLAHVQYKDSSSSTIIPIVSIDYAAHYSWCILFLHAVWEHLYEDIQYVDSESVLW